MSSSSTLSDSGIKRRKTIYYFQGEGLKDWKPQTKLIIKDFDVTSFLQRYRKRNIRIAKTTNDLSNMKMLSLSYIYPADKYYDDSSITKHFEAEIKEELRDRLYGDVEIEAASIEAVFHCKKVSDRKDQEYQPVGPLDIKIKACCDLMKTNSQVMIQETSETSFMNKYLVPYLHEVFMIDPSPNTVFGMVDSVEESGAIPDFKPGYMKNGKKSLYAFFVEVKRPGQSSRYQAEDDFVKLLKQMKDIMNKQIDIGFTKPFSFGLLVEGFRCKLYMMKIVEDGIYMPFIIKKISLMEDVKDAVNIPAMTECLMFVKTKLATIDQAFKERDRTRPLNKFIKPSFHTEFK